MAYTGYLIIQYVDDNPNSPTYGEAWFERVLNENTRPSDGDGEWSLVSSSCEMDTSGFTGYRVNVYYNDALNQYSSTTVADADCSTSAETYTEEEIWVNSGDPYCQIDEDGNYTGWGVQLQVQKNFNLPNYGETKEVRISMAECSGQTEAQWEEISRQCHIVADGINCSLSFDGTADVLQIDVNPSSPTFNQTRTINEESEDCYCEVCDSVEEEWRFVDDICGIQMPSEYDLTGLTDDTLYHVYRKYAVCIIGGERGRSKPMNEFSAVTYQTGFTECSERWVDTDETICVDTETPLPSGFKLRQVSFYGTTTDLPCVENCTALDGQLAVCISDNEIDTTAEHFIVGSCVTQINTNAFKDCTRAIYIEISNGVKYLGGCVFQNCSGLTSITIPNSVTSIGRMAFAYCTNLRDVTLPDTITALYDNTFAWCGNLTTIRLPRFLQLIDGGCFGYCSGLTEITIPDSVTTIGNDAFAYCSSLSSVTIPDSVTSIGYETFKNCSSLTSVTIPSGITSIGLSTFQNCSGLTSIAIPSGVTSIDNGAFQGCSGLTGIIINASTPPTLGTDVFEDTNNCPLYVPADKVEVYKAASGWSTYALRITAITN